MARLGQVCSRARLRVTVDDQVRLDRTLAAGAPGQGPWKSAHHLDQWNVWVSDYDEEIAIDVPAGRHDVTFANTEGDWLQIRSLLCPTIARAGTRPSTPWDWPAIISFCSGSITRRAPGAPSTTARRRRR